MVDDIVKHVETLERLGLTSLQARIYLTTVTLQKASVSRIATTAEVARPDVYHILMVLEKRGLIRKATTKPLMYEATPVKEGCMLLLQSKREEYLEAQEKSQLLIQEFSERTYRVKGAENFSLINSEELLLERFAVADEATKKSLDIISDWATLAVLLFNMESFRDLMSRGVRVRLITEKVAGDKKQEEVYNQKSALFEMRFFKGPAPIRTAIYDGKVMNMRVRTQQDRGMTPALWSDNSEFVQMIMAYYENIWDKTGKV
jgi:sugar-specific transcriptional regulator TrmB